MSPCARRRATTCDRRSRRAWKMPELPSGRGRLRAPHPVLATPGAEVDPTDPAIVRLAADLLATQGLAGVRRAGRASRSGSRRGCSASTCPATRRRAPATARSCCATPRCSRPAAGAGPRGLHVGAGLHRRRQAGPPDRRPRRAAWHRRAGHVATDAFEAVALQHEIDHTTGRSSWTGSPARTPSTPADLSVG